MTFLEKYKSTNKWYERALIMEIYHLTKCHHDKTWTITKTANDFDCSIGLVSENLKLAHYIHMTPSITKLETRQAALQKVK